MFRVIADCKQCGQAFDVPPGSKMYERLLSGTPVTPCPHCGELSDLREYWSQPVALTMLAAPVGHAIGLCVMLALHFLMPHRVPLTWQTIWGGAMWGFLPAFMVTLIGIPWLSIHKIDWPWEGKPKPERHPMDA